MGKVKFMQGFSRRDWIDLYYDGEISVDEYYDQENAEIIKTPDPWDTSISTDDKFVSIIHKCK